jgi:hypothetical protein
MSITVRYLIWAEEAVNYYVRVMPGAKVISMTRYGEEMPLMQALMLMDKIEISRLRQTFEG